MSRAAPGRNKPRRSAGAALLVAVLIMALASVLAVELLRALHLDIARSASLDRDARSRALALGAESLARRALDRDSEREPAIDTNDSPWRRAMGTLPVPGGSVTASLRDLDGRFNVNTLVLPDGGDDEAARARFERLLRVLGLEPRIGATLADWIDADTIVRRDGAEDPFYAGRRPAYRAANRPLVHISELRLVAGVDADAFNALLPHVCALPVGARRINVNTASEAVLMSLLPGVDQPRARRLHSNGRARYSDTQQFRDSPALAGLDTGALHGRIKVRSDHFLLHARVRQQRRPRDYYALLQRDGTRYDVVFRSFGHP